MHKLRHLGMAAYAVAFLLILVPLLDTATGVLPARPGDIRWRFGTAGLISRAILTPLFGMLVAIITATLLEHRRMARVLAVFSLVAALLGAAAMGMFGLDTLQARANVRTEVMSQYDTAAGLALLKYLLGVVTATLLGIGAWKTSRDDRAGRTATVAATSEPASTGEKGRSGILVGGRRESAP